MQQGERIFVVDENGIIYVQYGQKNRDTQQKEESSYCQYLDLQQVHCQKQFKISKNLYQPIKQFRILFLFKVSNYCMGLIVTYPRIQQKKSKKQRRNQTIVKSVSEKFRNQVHKLIIDIQINMHDGQSTCSTSFYLKKWETYALTKYHFDSLTFLQIKNQRIVIEFLTQPKFILTEVSIIELLQRQFQFSKKILLLGKASVEKIHQNQIGLDR